jgi:hypothetical protein
VRSEKLPEERRAPQRERESFMKKEEGKILDNEKMGEYWD